MSKQPIALLVGAGWGIPDNKTLVLYQFDHIIQIWNISDVKKSLHDLEAKISSGFSAIGFLSYEAAGVFDLPIKQGDSDLPYCGFYLFRQFELVDLESYCISKDINEINLEYEIHENDYHKKIKTIKSLIARGDTYQVNYTIRTNFDCVDDPLSLFLKLYQAQPVPYGAFLKVNDKTILSLSPELFFLQNDSIIISKPMKGTIKRGRFLSEDQRQYQKLNKSEKDHAENVMITDMVRNDLGRICDYGSIVTTKLFEIEKYQTLFQMTSTVQGQINNDVSLYKILEALFPAASITGAPKVRTMELIRDLEMSNREIYCGSIGLIQSSRKSIWNVAIRTMWGNQNGYKLGVGGGIVWDSIAEKEYQEIITKTQFVKHQRRDFFLFETLLLDENHHYIGLDDHLQRLKSSANFFDFNYDHEKILKELQSYKQKANIHPPIAVKLILKKNCEIEINHRNISIVPDHVTVEISPNHVNSQNVFLFHKTSQRNIYDDTRKVALKKGIFEVLHTNEHGFITEGCITNIFIRKDEQWITPPVADGLLPGIWRKHFLWEKKAKECSLKIDDILNSDEVIIGNSVMGDIAISHLKHPPN